MTNDVAKANSTDENMPRFVFEAFFPLWVSVGHQRVIYAIPNNIVFIQALQIEHEVLTKSTLLKSKS